MFRIIPGYVLLFMRLYINILVHGIYLYKFRFFLGKRCFNDTKVRKNSQETMKISHIFFTCLHKKVQLHNQR